MVLKPIENKGKIFLVLVVISLMSSVAFADLQTVSMRLQEPGTENPITTPTNITWRIHDSLTGGSYLWEENFTNVVPSSEGRLSRVIGLTSDLGVVTFNESIWLETITDGETHAPRLRWTSVGSSLDPFNFTQAFIGTSTTSLFEYNPLATLHVGGTFIVQNTTGTTLMNITSNYVSFPGIAGTNNEDLIYDLNYQSKVY